MQILHSKELSVHMAASNIEPEFPLDTIWTDR
jgi:hypothetical protein